MTDYAVMPKADYVAVCDAIREKTGDTQVIKSGELAGKLNDVYNAGAVNVLQGSKYMYPTVSGEVLKIDDLSAVPHKVSVTKRSKNLLTAQQVYNGCRDYSELVEDGRNCVRFIDSDAVNYIPFAFRPKTQYTASFWVKREVKVNEDDTANCCFRFKYDDGTYKNFVTTANYGEWIKMTATSEFGKTISTIGMASYTWKTWVYIDVDTFQFEEGVTATVYTPYMKDLGAVKIRKFGINLFKTYRDVIISNPWVTPDTPITPTGNQVYKGISYSNYQISGNVSDLVVGDTISFVNPTNNIQYGIGFDVKVTPNTTYTLSIGENNNGKIAINCYDGNGKYLTAYTDQYTFTTNAKSRCLYYRSG